MMLVVRNRGIHPATDGRPTESLRIKLPAQMPINVIHDRKEEKNRHMGHVHWNRKIKNQDDSIFQNRLQRVKSIRRPRGRIRRLVMY